jgi:hypothetical protein
MPDHSAGVQQGRIEAAAAEIQRVLETPNESGLSDAELYYLAAVAAVEAVSPEPQEQKCRWCGAETGLKFCPTADRTVYACSNFRAEPQEDDPGLAMIDHRNWADRPELREPQEGEQEPPSQIEDIMADQSGGFGKGIVGPPPEPLTPEEAEMADRIIGYWLEALDAAKGDIGPARSDVEALRAKLRVRAGGGT